MPFPVNINPGSWSFVFFLLEIKYEISPKVTKNPISLEYAGWQSDLNENNAGNLFFDYSYKV